jgi:beta-lactamase regulating signal transducer with metallopeptidase domain
MTTLGLERLALDHLWQSTLFALGAGLLVLAFRRAPAGVRYGLWFSASVKFLVPFAALAALGRLALERFVAPGYAPAGAALIERTTRPLSQFPLMPSVLAQAPPPLPSAGPATPAVADMGHAAPHVGPHIDLSLILLALWALGCGLVLARWVVQAAKVRAALRSARPLPWPAAMPVLAAPSLLEPGLVGVWRPVLVVPQSLPERLTQPQIEALVAHETCHLRRHDNLTASVHMLVEALVWFHPLAWWIGARMIEERERACDEAVVRAGHDRVAYARSLIEVCRFYLQTPLLCVAGASGSHLKTRVETIMTAPLSSPLSRLGKALLLAAGACAVATPVTAGLLTTPVAHDVVAKALALASSATPRKPAPSSTSVAVSTPVTVQAPPSIVLARNEAALDPGVAVIATDTPPIALARDVASPRMPEALPLQLASVETTPAAQSTALTAEPADPSKALEFVRSYAKVGLFGWAVRLDAPICAQVLGLPPDQAAAVKDRIEAIGQSMSLRLFSVYQTCGGFKNIQVLFTPNAQQTLDQLIAHQPSLVGDSRSDTRDVKAVTRPVQAWYRTRCYESACSPDPVAFPSDTVTVLVDARRVEGVNLGVIADYAAMLALAEPRFPDRCQVLPSVLDLFAGSCAGRAAPSGITPSDLAYLRALYTAGRSITAPEWTQVEGGGTVDQIAGRMAMLMSGHGSMPVPGPKPEKR